MGGWLGLALTSANRRISADFLHHFFFLLFLLSFYASLLAQAIFLIVKRRKVCVCVCVSLSSNVARRATTVQEFHLWSSSADTNVKLVIGSFLWILFHC